MSLDPVRNFAIVTVNTGYDDNDVTIVLSSGHGALLPDPATEGAFNLVWWNSTDYVTPQLDAEREIIRVTARSSDTLTVERPGAGNNYNGEGSTNTAENHNTGGKTYKMILSPTRKYMEDIKNHLSEGKANALQMGYAMP